MESKELRIGNKIYGVSDRIETVTLIKENGLIESYPGLFKEANSPQEVMYCSGIPLSEEILLKCGFSKFHEFSMADANYRISTKERYLMIELLHGKYIANIYHQVEIKYLHQLQNLYFALTGQELNTSGL